MKITAMDGDTKTRARAGGDSTGGLRAPGRRALSAALIVAAAAIWGCGNKSGETGAAGTSASGATSSGAAAAATGPGAAEVAAVKAGKWKDPDDGHEIKLVDTALSPCFGFKGYSIQIPEGSTVKTMEGARTCHITLAGTKKEEWHMAVFTDEVKVPFMSATRDKVQNVTGKPFDEPDAFLYEVDDKGKKDFNGWYMKKLGPYTVRCNSLRWKEGQVLTYAFQRAVLEVCKTLSHKAP